MRANNFALDFEKANAPAQIIARYISRALNTDMRITEHLDDEFYFEADRKYGCDGFLFKDGKPTDGIAVRVQEGDFSTFTVRYSRATGNVTEFAKRLEAIRTGELFPKFTLQAYIKSAERFRSLCLMKDKLKADPGFALLRVGMIYTEDLYNYIESRLEHFLKYKREAYDGNSFFVVRFEELLRANARIKILDYLPAE